jgi:ABC-type lipoprotein release transport system permease subunit
MDVAEIVSASVSVRAPTFAGAAAILDAVALIACTIPAWRAARIDPMVTRRAE